MISASPIKFLVANQNICSCLGTHHPPQPPQLDIFQSLKQHSTKKSLTAIKTIGPLLAANSVRKGSHKMPAINLPLSLDFITSPTTAICTKIILFGRFPFRTKVNRNVQEREADRKLAENTESAKDRSEVRRARGPGGLNLDRS